MEGMNSETIIAEFQKLPPDQKEVVRDALLADDQLAALLKDRAKGPFVPFDPEDEAFFNDVRKEGERLLAVDKD